MPPSFKATLKLYFGRPRSLRVYMDSIEVTLWTPSGNEQTVEVNYFDQEDLDSTINKIKGSSDIQSVEVVSTERIDFPC